MSGTPSSRDYTVDIETGDEAVFDKITRKAREQPWVPLGVLLTCGALHLSARALRNGDSRLANRMFTWRVILQGLTVAGLVAGGYMYGKPQRPTDRDAILHRVSKEREKLWIDELERLDAEAKLRADRAQEVVRDRKEELRRQFETARANSGKPGESTDDSSKD